MKIDKLVPLSDAADDPNFEFSPVRDLLNYFFSILDNEINNYYIGLISDVEPYFNDLDFINNLTYAIIYRKGSINNGTVFVNENMEIKQFIKPEDIGKYNIFGELLLYPVTSDGSNSIGTILLVHTNRLTTNLVKADGTDNIHGNL